MRIIHLITRLIIGGAQENTILSCEGLHALGHHVHLMSGPTIGPEGSLVSRARKGGYQFEEVPSLVRQVSPLTDLTALQDLRRRFVELKPDVVHTHSSKAGIIGRIAAHQARVPLIIHTIHGMSFNRTQSALTRYFYAGLERYCAKRCHLIVSVADAMTRQSLAAGIGSPSQYRTVRSGMVVADFNPAEHDAESIRERLRIPASATVIGTVARLFRNKGYEQLLDVMEIALRANPKLHFLWIGDGAQRLEYEQELTRRAMREKVTLSGLVTPSQMPELLAAIDILAHTSQWEGLPRAVVQALLMEKPVVSFDIDGAPEVVIPGRTGELAPLGDVQAFARSLLDLATDRLRRREFGIQGRRHCLGEFDHLRMVQELDKIYRQ